VADRFDADHFSLHGLWPQPESNVFCGVTKKNQANSNKSRWNSLPEPKLSPETRAALNEVMPGTASNLQRHEYNKHGTCFHGTAEDYFRTSVNLMKQVNQSKLRDWMAQHIGQEVAVSDLQREFAASFGDKAGSAMSVHCIGDVDSRRTLISEIWINLQDPLTESAELADVLDTAAGTSTNCRKAVVDPAGLN
jgi:ribonuclease T2